MNAPTTPSALERLQAACRINGVSGLKPAPVSTELSIAANPDGTFDVRGQPNTPGSKPATLARCKTRGIAGLLVKAMCEASRPTS